jgi:hypothetical protein
MTAETLQKIADVTGLEPFAVIKGQADNVKEHVFVAYMGELTLMASFYLASHAQKYAEQVAEQSPMWKVVLVGSLGGYVKHITAPGVAA